jgi:hypothetical protein
VATVILILTRSVTQKTGKTGEQSPSPTPQTSQVSSLPTSNFIPPTYSQPSLNSAGQVDATSKKVTDAISNKTKLAGSLPIYIANFKTSNGLKTSLNIYTIPGDPDYLIHVEIYGIDFENQNISKEENPNVTAFIESFQEIKRQLKGKGVDIHNIFFIFGQKVYIQQTAELWIKTFNLL